MIVYNVFKNNEKNLGSFEDNRGTINDIFVKFSIQHASWVSSKENAIRGNHYHKYTTQYTLVLSGSLLYRSKNMNNLKMDEGIFEKGSFIISPPMEAHAMQALNGDCEFIAFASGPRGGRLKRRIRIDYLRTQIIIFLNYI